MAKSKSLTPQRHAGSEHTVTTPSRYGSHESMVDEDATAAYLQTQENQDMVVCKDDDGLYVTERRRLIRTDSVHINLADANRCRSEQNGKKQTEILAKLKADFLAAKKASAAKVSEEN